MVTIFCFLKFIQLFSPFWITFRWNENGGVPLKRTRVQKARLQAARASRSPRLYHCTVKSLIVRLMDSERENNGHQLIETIATETIGSAVCRYHLVKDQLVPLKSSRLTPLTSIANGTLLQSVNTVLLFLFRICCKIFHDNFWLRVSTQTSWAKQE